MSDHEDSFRKQLVLFCVPRIIRLLILCLGLTYRKVWVGLEHLEGLKRADRNWIYASWHNNILMNVLFLRNQKLVSLVSASSDGRIAARLLELMGNETITGSSSRDGIKALLRMIKLMKSGRTGAITPDGPRGPRYKLQDGIIYLSQKTGVPLVPIHIEATRQWIFEKSWDKHKLPKPFSTVVIQVGRPFHVSGNPNKDEMEAAKIEFETEMMKNVQDTIDAKNKLKGKL